MSEIGSLLSRSDDDVLLARAQHCAAAAKVADELLEGTGRDDYERWHKMLTRVFILGATAEYLRAREE